MKIRIFIACSVTLAIICLLFYLRHNSKPEANPLPKADMTLTNRQLVGQTTQPQIVEHHQITNIAQIAAIFPPKTPLAKALAKTNPVAAIRLALWQAPIEFYGKVVDENSNAVAGTKIGFHWVEIPTEEGNRTSTTESDAAGLFSLHGQRGPSLTVWFSKEGYYSSRGGQMSFNYASGPDILSPDPQNPVVFCLRKKGTPEPLMRLAGAMIGPRQYRLDTKDTPTDISFYTGKRTPQGAGQFRVAYGMDVPPDPKQWQFDWRCQVTVPGGGLQATTEEFPFTAPEEGYQETIEIDSNTNAWSDRLEQTYYIHLSDGKYGRIILSLVCSSKPFFGVEALINPSGSRSLEYDKYLPGNIMVDQSAP